MSSTAAKSSPKGRSAARLAAVQGLYQMDIAKTDLNDVITELLTYAFDPIDAEQGETLIEPVNKAALEDQSPDPVYLAEILRGVMRRQVEIDKSIDRQLATGWNLVRIDSTLRAILRAGVFELLERPDVPVKVVISEYVRIAHAFFDDDEPKVVNGIMDVLAHKYRAAEFGA